MPRGLVARLALGDKLYGLLAIPTIAAFGPSVRKNHFAGLVEMAACLAVGLAVGLADETRRGDELGLSRSALTMSSCLRLSVLL